MSSLHYSPPMRIVDFRHFAVDVFHCVPNSNTCLNIEQVTVAGLRAAKESKLISKCFFCGVIGPWEATENPLPELFGEAEFYNVIDIASEDPLSMSAITVVDGEDIEDLNIALSRSSADNDGIENLLDLSLFSQSPFTDSLTVTATSRCQPNTVDYAALIGVEEIVGTTAGDDDGEDDTGGGFQCSRRLWVGGGSVTTENVGLPVYKKICYDGVVRGGKYVVCKGKI